MYQDDSLIRTEGGIIIDDSLDEKFIKDIVDKRKKSVIVHKGGPGSGHFSHAGIHGHTGGSLPGKGTSAPKVRDTKLARVRFGHLYKKENLENVSDQNQGGCFRSGRAHVKDDGDVILKYHDENIPLVVDYRGEVEAYEAAERMGFKHLVPRTEKTTNPDTGETCSAQKVATGNIDYSYRTKKFPNVKIDQFSQLAVLDTITGNEDRHGRNLLVSQDNGRIYVIDNNLAFMKHPGFHGNGLDAAKMHWQNVSGNWGGFKVLAKHIAAGDRLVNNKKWRKRVLSKFHKMNKDVLSKMDSRWAKFKADCMTSGWWTGADEAALMVPASVSSKKPPKSSAHGVWNQ